MSWWTFAITTRVPGTGEDTRADHLDRDFVAPAPNRVWVADIPLRRTFAGWVYAAFVIDVYSRRVVGWQPSESMRTDLVLDALEMGLWTRAHAGRDTTGVIAHSDKGVQYLAVRYIDDLEIAVAEYIDWFNHRRLHGEIGLVPPSSSRTSTTGTTPPRLPSAR